jgi:hypothetical protein
VFVTLSLVPLTLGGQFIKHMHIPHSTRPYPMKYNQTSTVTQAVAPNHNPFFPISSSPVRSDQDTAWQASSNPLLSPLDPHQPASRRAVSTSNRRLHGKANWPERPRVSAVEGVKPRAPEESGIGRIDELGTIVVAPRSPRCGQLSSFLLQETEDLCEGLYPFMLAG